MDELEGLSQLQGVSESLLYTLFNRASEARRPGGYLYDPTAVRLLARLPDLRRRFGPADPSIAIRSRVFDDVLRPWLWEHPGATVVELGCGLETQLHRLDDGKVRWVAVDVPEVIALRERLLPAGSRCTNLASSALDPRWMEACGEPGFITAQGLFMYFPLEDVSRLVARMLERFPGVQVLFDVVPPAFAAMTRVGLLGKTAAFRFPPMGWGMSRGELLDVVPTWSSRVESVEVVPLETIGWTGRLFDLVGRSPVGRVLPSIVRVVGRR